MHIIISLLLNALALFITAHIVPGFFIPDFQTLLWAAIVLAVINTIIRPIFLVLTLPLNLLTLGLFTFVINAFMLWLATLFVPGFIISSVFSAILAAFVLSVVSFILARLRNANP